MLTNAYERVGLTAGMLEPEREEMLRNLGLWGRGGEEQLGGDVGGTWESRMQQLLVYRMHRGHVIVSGRNSDNAEVTAISSLSGKANALQKAALLSTEHI
jgi:hypothetical protein